MPESRPGIVELSAASSGHTELIIEEICPERANTPNTRDGFRMSVFDAGELARRAGVRDFILTHMWATAGFDRYQAAATAGFGGRVTLATPGVELSTM